MCLLVCKAAWAKVCQRHCTLLPLLSRRITRRVLAADLQIYYDVAPKGSTPRGQSGDYFFYTFKAKGDDSPPSRDDPCYKVRVKVWESKAALSKKCNTMKSNTIKYGKPVKLPLANELAPRVCTD